MDRRADTITTMGIISNEVYDEKYFTDDAVDKGLKIDGTNYKVLDYQSTAITDFQGLLLQEEGTGKFVIAFRGTASVTDALVDLVIAGHYNPQFLEAAAFTANALGKEYDGVTITKNNLTLTGHSLGGILTQQVGAASGLAGYAYNPLGVNALTRYPLPIAPNILQLILSAGGGGSADHIVNVSYQDDGELNGDILSNLATELSSKHLGDFVPIWGNNVGLSGHSIIVLNNAISRYNGLLHGTNSSIGYIELSKAFAANSFSNKDDFNRTAQTIGTYLTGKASASIEFLKNYSKQEIFSLSKTDKSIAYALDQVNAFAIKGVSYGNVSNYEHVSQNYLNDRVDFILNSSKDGIYYYDQKTDVGVGLTNATSPGHYSRIVFISDNYVYAPAYGKTYGSFRFYGNEGNNIMVPSQKVWVTQKPL